MGSLCVSYAFVLAILGQPTPMDCDILLAKIEKTDPRNPAALLKLGQECEEGKCQRLAQLCYERVCKLGAAVAGQDPVCEASFRLARMELAGKKYEKAFARLREITLKCPTHEAARSLLQSAESAKTREQVLQVEKGDEQFEKGAYASALECYEKAYKLALESQTGAAFVPRSVVLGKLAECRDRIDTARREKEFLPQNRSVQLCPACSRSSFRGFLQCQNCGGDGMVEVWRTVRILTGFQRKKIQEPCTVCKQYGYLACGTCFALGYTSTQITLKEKKALAAVAESVVDPRLLAQQLGAALRAVEEALLTVKEGATLNYLRAMKPDYAPSKDLRKALGSVPPSGAVMGAAGAEWQKLAANNRAKVNFLVSYACEFAEYLRHFDLLRSSRKPEIRALTAKEPWSGDVLSPELLSAFPDENQLGCVAVKGVLTEYKEGSSEEHKGYLTVEGGARHSVVFFVWLPKAASHLDRLADGPWKRALEGLSGNYPFDIGEKLRQAPKDHHVHLAGRFLRDRFGYPRNWFEVWHFEVGLSRTQEEMFRALSEPVDISFPGHTLRQIAQIFRDWFDLELKFDGVGDSAVASGEARECPRGLVVHALARSVLGCDWYYQDGGVVFCRGGRSPRVRDMAAVLERLERLRTPAAVVSAQRGAGESKVSFALPEDPAGLRVAARQAILDMRYDLAERCFEALDGEAKEAQQKEAISRVRDKMRLFDELTGGTPVSRLADAAELTEIFYQKGLSGDVVHATVILTKKNEAWWIQEAYGASRPIGSDLNLKKVTPIAADDWRKRKEEELLAREKECAAADPQDRAGRLFFLALFAKTNKFTERGSEILNQAIELPDFEAFLKRFFPDRSDKLILAWRHATGQGAPEATPKVAMAPAAGEVPPESGASETGGVKRTGTPAASEVPDRAVEPLPEGLSDADLLAHARRYASEGSTCARKVLAGENAGVWRRLAIDNLTQAERAIARYIEKHVGDPSASRIQADINLMKSACVKDMGFFE